MPELGGNQGNLYVAGGVAPLLLNNDDDYGNPRLYARWWPTGLRTPPLYDRAGKS
ncbi:hypothetical protein ACFLX0_00700 [Chloroflexota bacterium]